MVYAAFIGPQQHGGYQVRIGKMIESADSITVDVIIITPGSGCFPPEGQTEPYTIIAMPATTKTVQPNQNQIFRPC
jgi:hypothetical protein